MAYYLSCKHLDFTILGNLFTFHEKVWRPLLPEVDSINTTDDPAHNQITEHSRIHTNAHERSETDNQIDNSSSLIIVTVELRTTIIILFVTLTFYVNYSY